MPWNEIEAILKTSLILYLSFKAFFNNNEVINIKYSLYVIIFLLLWR